jgi:REP element-mobilizing transposase RayT
LVFGIWYLVFGIWYLVFGIWYFVAGVSHSPETTRPNTTDQCPPSIAQVMSRPLRIEFPDAVYHVTSRADRREAIYRDEVDRQTQLDVQAQAKDRFDAQVLAYCLMGNHYHLVLHTRQGNLSRLMRHFNGVYTQAYNRRHGLVGHLFQGRFKAILMGGGRTR